MIPGARQIGGLAGPQPLAPGPMPEGGHGCRDLREIGRDLTLQIVNPTLTPTIDLGCRQPSDTYQHVNRGHEVAIGKGRLGRLDHPVFKLVSNCRAHGRHFRSHEGGCPWTGLSGMAVGRGAVAITPSKATLCASFPKGCRSAWACWSESHIPPSEVPGVLRAISSWSTAPQTCLAHRQELGESQRPRRTSRRVVPSRRVTGRM